MGNPLQAMAAALDFMPSGELNFRPYDMEKIIMLIGLIPPVQMRGVDSVTAKRLHPQHVFKPNLGGGGIFLSNKNITGEIRFRILASSWSIAYTEIHDMLGAPVSVLITDLHTGGTSTVIGQACKMVDKGEWTRGAEAPMVEITLQADKLWFFHGVRLLDS